MIYLRFETHERKELPKFETAVDLYRVEYCTLTKTIHLISLTGSGGRLEAQPIWKMDQKSGALGLYEGLLSHHTR